MKFYEHVIADFGGYEAAKKLTETEGAGMLHNIEALKAHLLNYRRANNIFDFTDKVVFTDPRSADVLMAVHEPLYLTEMAKIGSAGVRHATDEEIAAGHRL